MEKCSNKYGLSVKTYFVPCKSRMGLVTLAWNSSQYNMGTSRYDSFCKDSRIVCSGSQAFQNLLMTKSMRKCACQISKSFEA